MACLLISSTVDDDSTSTSSSSQRQRSPGRDGIELVEADYIEYRNDKCFRFAFPYKLHRLLDDASHDGNERIVSWLPHGLAFKIHSRKAFEELILPRYFMPTPKFRSFQRQLAIYGFELVKSPHEEIEDHGSYRHPLIIRGKPELCGGMNRRTRRRRKSGKVVGKSNPNVEALSSRKEEPRGSKISKEAPERTTSLDGPMGTMGHDHEVNNPDSLLSFAAFLRPRPREQSTNTESDDDPHGLLQFAVHANDFLAKKTGWGLTSSRTMKHHPLQAVASAPARITTRCPSPNSPSMTTLQSTVYPANLSSVRYVKHGGLGNASMESVNHPMADFRSSSDAPGGTALLLPLSFSTLGSRMMMDVNSADKRPDSYNKLVEGIQGILPPSDNRTVGEMRSRTNIPPDSWFLEVTGHREEV